MTGAAETTTHNVTRLLRAWHGGDQRAGDDLLDRVYSALRQTAGCAMRRERRGHSLQPTELVNETFMRLLGQRAVSWESRQHFLAIAAKMARRVLVDHARRRGRAKRGAGWEPAAIDDDRLALPEAAPEVDVFREALAALEGFDARKAAVVRLHGIAGFSVAETAARLGCSASTVVRDWRFTRVWLAARMRDGSSHTERM